jgi:ABC-type transport system involved in multi-copper enzyme maturation permease subunit
MPAVLRWFLNLAITNPIAVRLVQNGSRRTRHLYIRSIYLAVLIVVLLWLMLTVGGGGGALSYSALAKQNSQSFIWVAYLQIGLICVLAPVFMAGAIAQEANPKTWDIILTTPLSAPQIVLGNLFGRLFFILALLFASLPLFAITQYFGGVPGRSIFASYVVAGCAALLVGAIAIALAVSRLAGRRAVFAFYISVVSYLAVTAGISAMLTRAGLGFGPGGDGVTWMTAINPFLALYALLNPTTYPTAPPGTLSGLAAHFGEHPVRTWCVGSALLSLALMVASSITVRAGGLATLTQGRSSIPWYRRLLKLGAKGSDYRPPRAVWVNPIAWREAAARNSTLGRIVARWSFIIAGIVFGLCIVFFYHTGSLTPANFQIALITTVLAEIGVTTLVAINMSATAVTREREDGTLDLLLTTPITPRAYLTGKLRGLIAYLLPMLMVPVATLLIAGVYVITDGLGSDNVTLTGVPTGGIAGPVTRPIVLPEAGLILLGAGLPFLAFSVMVGMYFSLKSKGTIGSVVSTVALVGIVGGFFGVCGNRAAVDFEFVGPVLGALNPGSIVFALVDPANAMRDTVGGPGLTSARISLLIGAGVSAGLYAAVVYAMLMHMVKNFDFTVRKLAGTR